MEKDREMHDALRRRLLDAESAAKQDEATRQRHLQILQELWQPGPHRGTSVGMPGERLRQLFEEVRARGDHDLLRNWQLWLSELILARRVILVRSHLLVEWLLSGDHPQKLAEELNLLLMLLKTLPKEQLPGYWPKLAMFPYTKDVKAALLLIKCQEAVLAELEQPEENPSRNAADSLIQSHFEGRWLEANKEQEQLPLIVAHSLQLLQKLVTKLPPDYAAQQVPELMGIAQFYMQYGAEAEAATPAAKLPRKVQPAQQSAAYGQAEAEDTEQQQQQNSKSRSNSGRKNKVRKMRSLAKQRNQSNNNNQVNDSLLAAEGTLSRDRLLLMGNLDYGCLTGDSGENCPPSDSDQLPGPKQLRHLQAKVRISALQLLGSLTKQLPRRTLYGYWHALFPSADSGGGGHLLLVGQTDGNSRCRALALQLAAQLLYGSKGYLSQACSRGPSNYTPFAVSLASCVLSAYRSLCSILEREYAPPVLTQCLKCLAVLVQATPFEQLEMGFVYEFVGHVKKLIKNADSPVAVSALLVMEMLVATPKLTPEMASAIGLAPSQRDLQMEELQSPEFLELCDSDTELELEEEEEQQDHQQEQQQQQDHQQEQLEQQKAPQKPIQAVAPAIPRNSWLLRQVLRQLESLGTGPPMRVECFQVLLAMATHVSLLRGHQARLARVLLAGLKDITPDVNLYAARCLDSVGYQLGRLLPEPPEREMQLSFWLSLLPGIYGAYDEAAGGSLKCALCDALSNMGSFSFERLPPGQRNALLAFLSGCASDDGEEPLVRAAALRALAVYVLHPSLKADLVFVENAAELTLRIINDSQLAVRIKAAWAMGNISDALIAAIPNHSERVSQELLGRLIQAATQSCNDHDKVKANAVRSLGNLLQILQQQQQQQAFEATESMQLAMSKLLDCVRSAGSAKVKWNACHAIGNLVKHRAFFATNHLAGILFPALSQLVVQHANFKVRINATGVLLQVEQRQDFGVHFPLVWRSLLDALERSNALDNFEEYNHRDALQQQLCLAMAHLLTLAKVGDLPAMREALEEDRLDEVRGTWRRVAFRIVPEQSAPLFTCSPLLEQRLQAEATLPQQRSALGFIVSTLRLDP